MTVSESEIRRLQKLSCIALTPEEEKKLWKQLNDIIGFLGQLPQIKGDISSKSKENALVLRTLKGVKMDANIKKIMENVKHPVINNSIVIKSVLN